jgi:hypothetical protein
VQPTRPLVVKPLSCLKVCPPMPEPADPSDASYLRWYMQMVQWGQKCAAIPKDCSEDVRAMPE